MVLTDGTVIAIDLADMIPGNTTVELLKSAAKSYHFYELDPFFLRSFPQHPNPISRLKSNRVFEGIIPISKDKLSELNGSSGNFMSTKEIDSILQNQRLLFTQLEK